MLLGGRSASLFVGDLPEPLIQELHPTRLQAAVPVVPPYPRRPTLSLTDLVRRTRYAQRHHYPRTAPFLSGFTTQLLI